MRPSRRLCDVDCLGPAEGSIEQRLCDNEDIWSDGSGMRRKSKKTEAMDQGERLDLLGQLLLSPPENRHCADLEVKGSTPAPSVAGHDPLRLEAEGHFCLCSMSPASNLFCILEPLLRILNCPRTPRCVVLFCAVPALGWPLTLQGPLFAFHE